MVAQPRLRTASIIVSSALIASLLCTPAHASSSTVTSSSGGTTTVRVEGHLERLYVDSIAHVSANEPHTDAEGSVELLTFVRVDDALVPISDPHNTLDQAEVGDKVSADVQVPAAAVPASATRSSRMLSHTQAAELSSELTDPALVLDSQTVSSLASTVTSKVHRAFVLLPIPTDYDGTPGECGDVLNCDPEDWKVTNGPISETEARSLVQTASDYWSAQSMGAISNFTISGIKRVNVPFTSSELCNASPSTLINYWQNIGTFASDGADPWNKPDHIIAFTGYCSNGTDGFAFVGNSFDSGGIMQVRNGNVQTLLHELGHSFSLGHSNIEYTNGASAGLKSEYFGLYSPMAFTVSGFKTVPALDIAYQKSNGVLPDSQLTELTAGSSTQVLSPVSGTTGVRGLRYLNPITKEDLYVEFRDGKGADAGSFYAHSYGYWNLAYAPGIRVYSLTTQKNTFTKAHTIRAAAGGSAVYDTVLGTNESITIGDPASSSLTVRYVAEEDGKARVETTITKPSPALTLTSAQVDVAQSPKLALTIDSNLNFSGKLAVAVDGQQVSSGSITVATGQQQLNLQLPATYPAGKYAVTATLTGALINDSTATATLTVIDPEASSGTDEPEPGSGSGSGGETPTPAQPTTPPTETKPTQGGESSTSDTKPATTTAKLSSPTVAYGKTRKVAVAFSGAPRPTGKATLYVDGKKYATKSLSKGKATFALSAKLKPGKHKLKVVLPASRAYKASTISATITVPRVVAKISGLATGTKKVRVGKTYKDKFTVNTTAKLQRKVGGTWKSIKNIKKGSYTLKAKVSSSTKKTSYRVVIKSSSTVRGTMSKTLTLKPIKK